MISCLPRKATTLPRVASGIMSLAAFDCANNATEPGSMPSPIATQLLKANSDRTGHPAFFAVDCESS